MGPSGLEVDVQVQNGKISGMAFIQIKSVCFYVKRHYIFLHSKQILLTIDDDWRNESIWGNYPT